MVNSIKNGETSLINVILVELQVILGLAVLQFNN